MRNKLCFYNMNVLGYPLSKYTRTSKTTISQLDVVTDVASSTSTIDGHKQGRGGNRCSKVPSPSVSLYNCDLLNTLAEEHDVIFKETAAFLEHPRMKHSEKRELRCD